MLLVNEKKFCCGCTACYSICPKNAIQMCPDDKGFLYPIINNEKCISCNLCRDVCNFSKKIIETKYELFVVKHKDFEVIRSSRSGGTFTALTDYIIKKNGVVYGVLLDSNLKVKYKRASTLYERDNMRKSKYVQAKIDNVFYEILRDLKDSKLVFFSGTPCTVDGLKSFLRKKNIDTSNLILCDIICHSVTSPKVFNDYIKYYESKIHSKVMEYDFRVKNKRFSWGTCVERLRFQNGKIIFTDEYANLFVGNNIRPSCFNCKYASTHRVSDITLGDCWGGEKVYPDFVDWMGANLVFLNTNKARTLFEKIKPNIIYKPIDIEPVYQSHLLHCEIKSDTYEEFWKDYSNLDFKKFIQKWSKNNYSFINIFRNDVIEIMKLPFRILKKLYKYLCVRFSNFFLILL